ncbi:hypothetical protein F5887DRAFT_188283 [Amanita rubescens]|nr:hypothetical protein F5887DRAFT_188283 [Amanita rubescens]
MRPSTILFSTLFIPFVLGLPVQSSSSSSQLQRRILLNANFPFGRVGVIVVKQPVVSGPVLSFPVPQAPLTGDSDGGDSNTGN